MLLSYLLTNILFILTNAFKESDSLRTEASAKKSSSTSNDDDSSSSTILPSACNNLEDGYHYIQPFSSSIMSTITSNSDIMVQRDVAPAIKVYCSDGYTIINPVIDENVIDYFSTYHIYHYQFAAPDLDEHVNWQEWWLPSRVELKGKKNNKFKWSVTTTDCTSCLSSDETDYGDLSVYHVTPDTYGCNFPTKEICDYDVTTLECFTCTAPGTGFITLEESGGKCPHVQLSADSIMATAHSSCTEDEMVTRETIYLPSVVLEGTKYCVCYKPDKVSMNEANMVTTETKEEVDESDPNEITYLTQEDFTSGTYRILKSGTYILSEDITFDFNGLTDDEILNEEMSPNSEGAWFPHADQVDSYPGAGQMDGWYWLGFFAGITVESDDVTIDLNGKTIAQSRAFYYQQRWFVGIQLNNKPFVDSGGPTWTGAQQTSAKNVVIKNGIVGLSSHIGIHAVGVENVIVQDVQVRDFETHGIVFNGFNGLKILNVEVGPAVSNQLPFTGIYNLARMLMPSLLDANNDYGTENVAFAYNNNKEQTFNDLFDKLITEMDMVYKWAYYGITPDDESSELWIEAKKTFISEYGISRAGTQYGAVFRSWGNTVFCWGKYVGDESYGLEIDGLTIHDLNVATIETVGMGIPFSRDPINAPIPFSYGINENGYSDLSTIEYTGNVWTDLMIALRSVSESWWQLGRLSCGDGVCKSWAMLGEALDETVKSLECGFDSLGHVAKGPVGMKFENVIDINVKNVEIYNIHSLSDLGSDVCGAWSDGTDGGPMLQKALFNTGYGATMAYGIVTWNTTGSLDNTNIHDITSHYGPVYGVYVIDLNSLTMQNSNIYNLYSGLLNDDDRYKNDVLPNRANRACAIEMDALGVSTYDEEADRTASNTFSVTDVNQYCLIGKAGCFYTDGEEQTSFQSNVYTPLSCQEEVTYTFADGYTVTIDTDGKYSYTVQEINNYEPYKNVVSQSSSSSLSLSSSYHFIENKMKNNYGYLFVTIASVISLFLYYLVSKNNKNKLNLNINEVTPLIENRFV